jgi:hypothetical protein
VATASNALAWWPGSWPTRWATSDTVNPGGTSSGKTFGPAANTEFTSEKLEFLSKA